MLTNNHIHSSINSLRNTKSVAVTGSTHSLHFSTSKEHLVTMSANGQSKQTSAARGVAKDEEMLQKIGAYKTMRL
jgi:hypothetical protein